MRCLCGLPAYAESQYQLMFENIRRVTSAAGGATDDIIKIVAWAKDRSFDNAVNKEWLAMFPDEHSRPVRHTLSDQPDARAADLRPYLW